MALFLRPTGLAVGLALKELRYAVPRRFAPMPPADLLLRLTTWIPRVRLPETETPDFG